jgi:hypothetical protein
MPIIVGMGVMADVGVGMGVREMVTAINAISSILQREEITQIWK